ncbi:hypothetical protein FW774_17160 [Pedobacter sp. BS3]|uniref:hypothetical protein n=1 Tax=Pedobacter sp. BS3 TaxID=2567937 RepID=UPI0011EF6766|nr:hypothetical protein [Pedobacter sp. BS3]TZF81785.1 hypothetical protein FW774_17160 [Pedobacter sp. BS3]
MKNKNQMCQKEYDRLLSTGELAGIIDCSETLIRQVRTGVRNTNKGKGKLIKIADELNVQAASIAKTTLIEAIEKLIPLK